jgi:hypothetical protein
MVTLRVTDHSQASKALNRATWWLWLIDLFSGWKSRTMEILFPGHRHPKKNILEGIGVLTVQIFTSKGPFPRRARYRRLG